MPAAAPATRDLDAPTPGDAVVIVRRGMVERFAVLHGDLAADGVAVRWDRRVAERRRRHEAPPAAVERRRADRRRALPPSWTLLDFVVAWPAEGPSAPRTAR
jgi:hypothetical protein